MTTDEAFKKAEELLLRASDIWMQEIRERYPEAKQCYKEAVQIRDEYFHDNKILLTEYMNPF